VVVDPLRRQVQWVGPGRSRKTARHFFEQLPAGPAQRIQGRGHRQGALDHSFTVKSKDHSKVLVTHAESTYAVSKEKCDDRAGNDKDVCVEEAKAVEVKSLADAKLGKEIGEARTDIADEKRGLRLQGGHREM
jgi:hypothetical protein